MRTSVALTVAIVVLAILGGVGKVAFAVITRAGSPIRLIGGSDCAAGAI